MTHLYNWRGSCGYKSDTQHTEQDIWWCLNMAMFRKMPWFLTNKAATKAKACDAPNYLEETRQKCWRFQTDWIMQRGHSFVRQIEYKKARSMLSTLKWPTIFHLDPNLHQKPIVSCIHHNVHTIEKDSFDELRFSVICSIPGYAYRSRPL